LSDNAAHKPGPSAEILALHAAARDLLPRLHQTFEGCGRFTPPLIYRARLKRAQAIVDKVERKCNGNRPDYTHDHVTDVIGFRFVTLFRREIAQIAQSIFALVADNAPRTWANILLGASVSEYIQYYSSTKAIGGHPGGGVGNDLTELLETAISEIPGATFKLKPEPRQNYSSVHIVLRITVNDPSGVKEVPVEIQIRTIFEDAWAEVDHQLFYEYERKDPRDADSRRQNVGRHLNLLKQMMDTAAEYAGLIDPSVSRAPSRGEVLPSLDDIGYVREVGRAVDFPKKAIEDFVKLIERKEAIDGKAKKAKADGDEFTLKEEQAKYSFVADGFRNLYKGFPEAELANSQFRPVFYLMRMEEAICLLLSDVDKQIEKALERYRDISEEYPEFPTIWFRRGQTAIRLLDIKPEAERFALAEEAVDCYEQTEQVLNEVTTLEDSVQLLRISGKQSGLLTSMLPQLHAFALWITSDLRRRKAGATKRDLADLIEVIEIVDRGGDAGDEANARKRASNLLYYLVDAIEVGHELGVDGEALPPLSRVSDLLDEVEELIGLRLDGQGAATIGDVAGETKPIAWRRLHTLLRAALLVSAPDKARLLAKLLLDRLGKSAHQTHSKEDANLMVRAHELATDILFRQLDQRPR
jgi:ppGpp synthetase/RelA/SpoT-type nucleotidyltranferase